MRKRLAELETAGVPLHREEDPPDIWWSVEKDWFPNAVLFAPSEAAGLLRLLLRSPRSVTRDRYLARIVAALPVQLAAVGRALPGVVAPQSSETEELHLLKVEDALAARKTLDMKYYSANRGAVEQRRVSVQRITVGPPARFLAVCHRDGSLKWFRVDNVLGSRLDDTDEFRSAEGVAVDAVMAASLDGFHGGGQPLACAFLVRDPASRWVSSNLLEGMVVEHAEGGVRVVMHTASVQRLARFVVGLGADAVSETPELAAMVRELAQGALDACVGAR